MIKDNVTLKYLNTFSIDVSAYRVIRISSEEDLLFFWKQAIQSGEEVLILGAGSNVLFLDNYNGTVLLNRIKGISLSENKYFWRLHVCSGELWHTLVTYSLTRNMPGLENLALIPGYVGAALIHNIGAYGLELQSFCEYVDVLNLDSGDRIRFTADECQFGYRTSIFSERNIFCFNYAIVAVGFKINKVWKPILSYCGLSQFDIYNVTPYEIFRAVCLMRRTKLPDPLIFGNAGSFFKNPIVNKFFLDYLLNKYPDIPFHFYKGTQVQLSAKWLIERCHLKNFQFGHAAVCENQSLVLININQQATGTEIAALAMHIYRKVVERFGISLEPEVKFIDSFGEIDAMKLLSYNLFCT